MGINTSIGMLLMRAQKRGARFDDVLTIGRQSLSIPVSELQVMASRLGVPEIDWSTFAGDGFAEDFFRLLLGARSVSSIDYSDYQHVDIVHDLNTAVPPCLERRFDTVIDGGSLEHIFDVKQTLGNYMNMVDIGGRLFITTPANNMCGHGFYQFSPEVFYRVFNDANGFRVNDVILIETPLLSAEASRHWRYYRVVDPATAGRRILLSNKKPVMMFLDATRISDKVPFCAPPIQSDYRRKWKRPKSRDLSAGGFEYVPIWEELRRRFRQHRKSSLRNRRFFEPLDPLAEE
jgi:hypothetical protein